MSEITLEKIDILRNRFNISYSEAKKVLEKCDGDLVEALVYLEESQSDKKKKELFDKDEIVNYIKRLIEKGNVTRIRVKKDDEIIIDVPLNGVIVTGAISALYPKFLVLLTATLTATAVVTKITIEVSKEDGTVEVINKYIENGKKVVKATTSDVMEKVSDVTSAIKLKLNNLSDKEDNLKENSFSYKVNL
ncbi:DUF4342 domain-containing protein [Clostridium sp. CTA-19]